MRTLAFLLSLILFVALAGCTPAGQAPTATPLPPTESAVPQPPDGNITVGLELVAEGLSAPVALAYPPDASGRLFIVDQVGLIRLIDAEGALLPEPFLDVRDRMVELNGSYDERGLLGLTFHPDYATNGRLFVY